MLCPHCQKEIKDQVNFCKHCGQPISDQKLEQLSAEPLIEQSEHKNGHMMESNKELVQSDTGTESSFFTAPPVQDSAQNEVKEEQAITEQQVDSSHSDENDTDTPKVEETTSLTHNKKLLYQLSLIAAGSSTLLVWIIGGLFSFITNKSLLSTLWNYIATNIIALPIEKTVLIEQQVKSSIWFIVNSFVGGQFSGKYSVNGELLSSFELRLPILLAVLTMLIIVWLHMKGIAIVLKKRSQLIPILHKVIVSIVYFSATWLLIIIPLAILSPKLHIPFIEAPEQLKLRVSLLSSFLNSAFIFTTGASFVWLPWKKWKKVRSFFIATTMFTSLLAFCQLYVQLWRKSSFEIQQLVGLHHSGLDLLWLNRLVAELLMSFGGRVGESNSVFITMLHLPSTFSWQYSLIFVIGICLIIVLHTLKASWTELISIAALSSWFIYMLNQLTKMGLVQQLGQNDLVIEKSTVYQLGWIGGLLIPICIILLSVGFAKLLAPLFSTKIVSIDKGWLNHIVQRKKLYAGLLILLLISFITVLSLMGEHNAGKPSLSQKGQYEKQWAKQLYLMQQAPPQYALIQANEVWAEQGTEESKVLLAVAYLQAYQPNKAQYLLSESLLTSNKLFNKEQITQLMEASNFDNPLSVIHTGSAVASMSNDEVEYLVDEAIETYVMPIVTATLDAVEKEVLPKLVGDMIETIKAEMQLEPEYIEYEGAFARIG